jgi:malate dehydrogenase (oxaloacetate-decarboxylating)
VAESVSTPHRVIDDAGIFKAHEGGELSVELKSPLDPRVGLAVAAALAEASQVAEF